MGELKRRLELALEAADMAPWDAHPADGKVEAGTLSWSARGAALLGLKTQALEQPFAAFLECVHPDDRERVVGVLQDGTNRCGAYSLEYRIVWPDGTLHWLASRARAYCNAGGQPDRTLGMVWDITERMRSAVLAAEREELAELTLGSIGDGIITTDAHGKTRYLNRVAEQLTGWTCKLAKGKEVGAVLMLADETEGDGREHVALRCLRERHAIGASPHSELVTRDGRHLAIEVSSAPIWSRSGQILGAVAVFRDVSHERKLSRQLSWQESHDVLTGLLNRREFESRTAAALDSARQESRVHTLLHLDLDRFQVVNDTCGHGAGDVLLQLLSKMLQTRMRGSDILARLGGDEFGVLLPYCPPAQARLIAEQILQAVREFRFVWEERTCELGASIGLVEISQDSKSVTELLTAADQACFLAREQGGSRIHAYRESDLMLARRYGEMMWVSRLNEAFEREYFRLYAMPIVSLAARVHETHDEVLIRIVNEKGELILPSAFIPAAEHYNLMQSVDRWVIQAVCQHIKSVRDALPALAAFEESHTRTPALYSVNLSGASLADAGLHDYITSQFVLHEIAPEQICFEITETAAIANLSKAQVFMAQLKALGCRFSLDDFGTGLSSFGYLKALPVDYLKIDGIFVRDIARNPVNLAMVKAINDVGHAMGMLTVAEYVEDRATLDVVRELGVDYAQGHAVGFLRSLQAGCD